MVKLEAARTANAALVDSQPLVAVFVGGSQGIGEYTLRALVRTHANHGKGLRVYLVGRNEEKVKAIFDDCKSTCPDGQYHFIKATDLTLLRDVDVCSKQIAEIERKEGLDGRPPKIDLLFMTQGFIRFGDPSYTTDGLDVSSSLLYYSRMRFTVNLLPLLTASPRPGHVVSVYAAGLEKRGTLHLDDLALTDKSHYSFSNARTHAVYMTTMFFERLAKQNLGKLSLVHIYPGLVLGPGFEHPSYPAWVKLLWAIFSPVVKLFIAIPPEESGERMLFLASARYQARRDPGNMRYDVAQSEDVAVSTDGVPGGGAYSCNFDGETNDVEKCYVDLRKDGFEEKVWEHTQQIFSHIGAAGNAV